MIISLAHNKGGVGKTTLSLNLSAVLNPDIIVDQDTHQNLVILNQLRNGTAFNVTTCESRDELISILKQSGEGKTILIDCGGFDSDLNRIAVAASDLVIVPANDDINEVIGLRRFHDVLEEISQEMGRTITGHVLFNRVHPNRKKFDEVESFLANANHLTRLDTVIPHRKAYPTALAQGMGVTEHKATKYSDASREMVRLGDEIKSKASL